MKIIISQSQLNKALSIVQHGLAVRTTSSILEGIYLNISDGIMKMRTTDTNVIIDTSIPIKDNETFETVIPGKIFINIISKLSNQDLILEFDNNKLKITSGGYKAELVCLKVTDYPQIKNSEVSKSVKIKKQSLKNLIRKTAFSASLEDYNGVLTGVLFKFMENKLQLVAVDPFRIATNNEEIGNSEQFELIVPAKLLNELNKIISDEGEESLNIQIFTNKVVFQFDDTSVTINTINGKYIEYEKILNKEGSTNIRINKKEILKAIDRASLMASIQNNNLIKLEIQENQMTVKSLSDEGNIEEKIDIINYGSNMQIGINSKYMKDALSNIDDDEIIMNFNDQVSPCIIKPISGENYKYLVLPIRIN